MSQHADIWLTRFQAVYFLITGDSLFQVMRRSDEVLIGASARTPTASVPLSANAGFEERTAALKELKEELSRARKNRSYDANTFLDLLAKTGVVTVQGRKSLSDPYDIIEPIELTDLRIVGSETVNAIGETVHRVMRYSGTDLSRARERWIASDVAPEPTSLPNPGAIAPEIDDSDSERPTAGPNDVSEPDFTERLSTPVISESIVPSSAKRRRGPAKGSLDRYREADRALFKELERVAQEDHVSLTAAAEKLANGAIEGVVVLGHGTPLTRAKRLVSRYFSDQSQNSPKPAETC